MIKFNLHRLRANSHSIKLRFFSLPLQSIFLLPFNKRTFLSILKKTANPQIKNFPSQYPEQPFRRNCSSPRCLSDSSNPPPHSFSSAPQSFYPPAFSHSSSFHPKSASCAYPLQMKPSLFSSEYHNTGKNRFPEKTEKPGDRKISLVSLSPGFLLF